jgi:inhibitor of cysteine peptidase
MKKGSILLLVFALVATSIFFAFSKKENPSDFDIEVKLNKEFNLEFRSNPSTGYRWWWVNKKDDRHVDSIRRTFIGDKPVMPGKGGKDIWTFKAIKRGIDTIAFAYKRPGNQYTNSGGSKQYRIRVY